MDAIQWLLLTYKVPPEPTGRRVSIWRRLKGMGAIYLQGGVCLLPKTDDHIRRLKIIENDVSQMGGEAVLLQTIAFDAAQRQKVLDRFMEDRNEQYRELLGKCIGFEREIDKEISICKFTYAELEEEDAEFRKLARWFEKIHRLDFYGAPLAQEARMALETCKSRLDDYARRVFDAHDENRHGAA
ncbi:MAG: hypothetical protein KGH84_02945 [Paracoccaceae bacterium]|nr:hypothetical protein [Paracoccaceae bacterium]